MIVGSPRSYYENMDWPEGAAQGNNTINYSLWFPAAVRLVQVRARMTTINTQGTYLLSLTNVGTGNTMLTAATFDMNTLLAATVTDLALTATEADRRLVLGGVVTVSLVSNNALFDGSGIYLGIQVEEV